MTKTKGQETKKQGKKRAVSAKDVKEEAGRRKEPSSSQQLFFGSSETKASQPSKARSGGTLSAAIAIGMVAVLLGLLVASYRANQSPDHVEASTDKPAEKPKTEAPAQPPAQVPPQNPGAQAIQTAPTPPPRPAVAEENWNDAKIAWQSYDAGLAKAKSENKPVCLVFYTTWCPHCRNYSKVFHDEKVVAKAKDFVMIRINPDEQKELGNKYQPDGGYVPRTYFLKSDGTLMADVHAPRPQYIYFYDENNPASILGGMDEALKKVKTL